MKQPPPLDQTWQILPWHLSRPLLLGVISLDEARQLLDLCLMHPQTWFTVPQHLMPALRKMDLLVNHRPPPIKH